MTGSSTLAGAVVGQAAAVPHRHRRPAQQPARWRSTPDKRIVWEFPSPDLGFYRGNEDVNFSPDGTPARGERGGQLRHPHRGLREALARLDVRQPRTSRAARRACSTIPTTPTCSADGTFITADIRNCRMLIIDPHTDQVVTQWGAAWRLPARAATLPRVSEWRHSARQRRHPGDRDSGTPGSRASPVRARSSGACRRPRVRYPSDAFPTARRAGDRGRLLQARASCHLRPRQPTRSAGSTRRRAGEKMLDHPSLARELPGTGDIIVADDLRERRRR